MSSENQTRIQTLQNEWNSVEKSMWENLKNKNITSSYDEISRSNFSSGKLFRGDVVNLDHCLTIPKHGDMVVGIQFYDVSPDQVISLNIILPGCKKLKNAIQVKREEDESSPIVPLVNNKYMFSLLNIFYNDIRLERNSEDGDGNGTVNLSRTSGVKFSIIYGYLKTEMRRKVAKNSMVCRNVKNDDDLFIMKGMGCVINKENTYVTEYFADERNLLIEQQGID